MYNERNRNYEQLDTAAMNGYGNVLLTGATGYLGAHLLWEAMTEKDWNVIAIVRAGSDAEAEERLKQKCAYYFGPDWFGTYRERIHAYAGDITRDRFGLDVQAYEKLLQQTDAIIHSAANVKHYGSYADFELQNVKATANLLAFAAEE